MILRRHDEGGTASAALFSPCGAYRYRLSRTWDPAGPTTLFVMLNPSTADETRNDPTVGRCETRARRAGHGGFTVCNLFAYRATRPADLFRAEDPTGPANDAILAEEARKADLTLCAWGIHGARRGRGTAVTRLLAATGARLFHLGLTRDGHPRHPLYLSYSTLPEPWQPEA